MFFTQIEFLFFFAGLFGILTLTKNNTIRKCIVLLVGCYVYAYWDYRFLALLTAPVVVDYWVGNRMFVSHNPSERRKWLFLSLLVNLGILGFFKYYNFFVSIIGGCLSPFGLNITTLKIILPLGISFYTFKTLSYVFDVYRGKQEPCTSLLDYAVYVSFFPTLFAGPIVRAHQFLPQLRSRPALSMETLAAGFRLFVIGFFLKVFVADRLALFVNEVMLNAPVFDSLTIWLAVLGYSLQLYCDFAGYSSMAMGVAKAMGYDLPENFNFPYISRNIAEFWKRWHITLSEWVRDYIYIPLGGNRRGQPRNSVNLLIAMGLCGLWHGAAWTFVFWGLLHGAALVVYRLGQAHGEARISGNGKFTSFLRWFVTILFVIIGWVFFSSPTIGKAAVILKQMFAFQSGVAWYHPFVIFVLIAAVLVHLGEFLRIGDRFYNLPLEASHTPAILFSMLWLCIIFYPKGFNPFIYAQF